MSKFFHYSTIYGADGEHDTPYMTRICIGRLRLHIFHRGDDDEDFHNHPWGFWTFPLTSYVEEVAKPDPGSLGKTFIIERRVVRKFKLHHRFASHTHRVIGPYENVTAHGIPLAQGEWNPYIYKPRKIVTIVWREKTSQDDWQFLKVRDGKWCWQHWRDYVFHSGKKAPCQDD